MAETIPLPQLGSDLLVTPFYEADEWKTLDLDTKPAILDDGSACLDLARAEGVGALQQALILRLLTPLGSLTSLGHASYGSRLHELVGRENTRSTRLLARKYVLEALAQERRIQKTALTLEIAPPAAEAPDRLRIFIRVLVARTQDAISLGLEVGL
ncbi:MAG TPA: DUF2634 domain-containing protein [Blastocatellia bacterium]